MQELLKKLLFGNAGGGNGGAPSLSLSFTDGGTFDPRITFSRGTNATLTDSNGRVAYAPHNLLTNSEDFEAAAWTKSNATVTANVTVAPDSTTTADKLAEDTATNVHYVGFSAGTVGNQETFSFYAKAAERTWCVAQLGSNGVVYYDLQNGVTGTVTSSTASIVSVGNGWFRCSISATRAGNTNNFIYAATANNTVNYAGTAGFGIFIWGAQLNITNAPVNLLTWSEDFTNAAWTKRGTCTVTSNAIAAPDGTVTADLISGLNTSGNDIFSTVATVPLNSPASPSFYINKVSATGTLRVGNPSDSAKGAWNVNLALVDSGWQRITLTHPAVTVVTSFVGNGSGDGLIFLAQAGGPLSFYLWGAQLNAGSVALPYVATTSSINVPPTYNSTTPKNLLGFTQEPENAAWTKSNSYVQQNLLTFSEDITNAAWLMLGSAGASRLADVTLAPNGSLTADSYSVGTGSGSWYIANYANTSIVSGQSYTFSVYLKANGCNFAFIRPHNNSANFGASGFIVSLVDGTITYPSSPTAPASTGTATAVGNGWWRVTATSTANLTTATTGGPGVWPCQTNAFAGTNGVAPANFTGNGTDGVFIWGAQLVQGADAGQYTQTTSAAAVTRYMAWDGTLTGRKLVENTATAAHSVSQNITAITGTPYVIYCYAKAAERQYLNLSEAGTSGWRASFDLLNGTVAGSGGTPSATIVSVGGGWYRCSILVTAAAAFFQVAAGISNTATPAIGGPSYTGDGTSGIYVTDFQLSNSASVDPYVYNPQAAAASAAFYGPRIDYDPVTLASRGLLIEEQRTNLLTYSEQFDNAAWVKTEVSIASNVTTAPDGSTSADKFIPSTNAASHWTNVVVSSTTSQCTGTVYVKLDGSAVNKVTMYPGGSATFGQFNLGALTSVGEANVVSTSIQNVGNGWYRLQTTWVAGTVVDRLRIYASSGSLGDSSVAGNGVDGIFIWGAQLEAGAFATSYIPTVASQVTRNADSASMLGDNFYTWYNPNQGTLYTEGGGLNAASSARLASITDNTFSNRIINYFATSGLAAGLITTSGVSQANPVVSITSATALNKVIQGYALNNVNIAANGTLGTLDTSATIPAVTLMRIGVDEVGTGSFLNGTIRSIRYYTVRLPDATLQQITS